MKSVSRLSFLKTAGAAAGAAAISASPAVAAAAEPDAVEMTPTVPITGSRSCGMHASVR